MPPRTAKQILAEWHELAMCQEQADDTDSPDGAAARIDRLRREVIEGSAPNPTAPELTAVDYEPRVQMKLPL